MRCGWRSGSPRSPGRACGGLWLFIACTLLAAAVAAVAGEDRRRVLALSRRNAGDYQSAGRLQEKNGGCSQTNDYPFDLSRPFGPYRRRSQACWTGRLRYAALPLLRTNGGGAIDVEDGCK
ncbi:hypothetical protein Hsero_3122 [Herbaspirillum seropedicae SmR1]|uniref:Uncharacterized protein n=1 Tax=Herbaspirillum seropedicae (strain SmR1) TaxID=757424 RepID=D8J137_HERSS|nr:hypothetical protein Hsero_3122 [Herbaspirillum seropedicae SmR1]